MNERKIEQEIKEAGLNKLPRAEMARLYKAHKEGCRQSFEKLSMYSYTIAQKLVSAMERAGVLGSDREDAISTGTLAAIESIETFDPSRGSFSTWAWINARSAIRKAGEEDVTRGVVGSYETTKEADFEEFDADLADDYGLTVFEPQEKAYEEAELRGIIAETLNANQRQVMECRYTYDMTLRETGLHLGISFQRASQLEQQSLELLKGVYL